MLRPSRSALSRRLATVSGTTSTRWGISKPRSGPPQPAPPSVADELERSACVVGPAKHIKRTVPSLITHSLAVEALAVTPSTQHSAIGSSLKARLAAQDTADGLRAKLSLYPSAKGLAPLMCLAPEAVHASDEFRYVFISGPTFWRKELAALCLRGGKDVIVAPPRTYAEAKQLSELAQLEGRLAVVYNELRFSPAVASLREVLLGSGSGSLDEAAVGGASHYDMSIAGGALGPVSELRLSMQLSPPLCCSDGHPTEEERQAVGGWWHDKGRGGGALGAAGVQAFELLQHLTGARPEAVHATFEEQGSGAAAPEYVEVQVRMENGATAELILDWRATETTNTPSIRVDGRDGRAELDLTSGRLELYHHPPLVLHHPTCDFGGSPVMVLREGADLGGADLLDEAHGALARSLMRAQEAQEGGDYAGGELDHYLTGSFADPSVKRSYEAVKACYASVEVRAWEQVL